MAEMLFTHRSTEKITDESGVARRSPFKVSSAGTAAIHGQPAAESALRVLRQQGVNVYDHQSTPFGKDHGRADLVLTMTKEHKEDILSAFPELDGRVFTLLDYAYGSDSDVADPFMQGDEAYRKAFREIDDAVVQVVERLLSEQKDPEQSV